MNKIKDFAKRNAAKIIGASAGVAPIVLALGAHAATADDIQDRQISTSICFFQWSPFYPMQCSQNNT